MPTLQELYPWLPVNTLPQEAVNTLEIATGVPVSPSNVGPTDYLYTLNSYWFDRNTGILGLSGTTPGGDPVQVPLSAPAQQTIMGGDPTNWSQQLQDTMGNLAPKVEGDDSMMLLMLILLMSDEK